MTQPTMDDVLKKHRFENVHHFYTVDSEVLYKDVKSAMTEWASLKVSEATAPSTEEQDELWEEVVRLIEDRQFREVKYPKVYAELKSKFIITRK